MGESISSRRKLWGFFFSGNLEESLLKVGWISQVVEKMF